ncbi:MAG TPA: hypothetical protein VH008_12985 [Pseudonocardia sp.]|jgi:hypothetical protein|nr:hypothetical protein [Pseudonocardia sp.]
MGERSTPEQGADQPRGESAPAAAQPGVEALLRWSKRHAEAAREARATESGPGATSGPAPGSTSGAAVRETLLGWLAGLLRLACWLVALLIVVYVVFRLTGANPTNMWAAGVESWAPRLDLGLAGLVSAGGPQISVVVNFGLAAIVWALLGTAAHWLVRRVAKL